MPRTGRMYPRPCPCGFLANYKQAWYSHRKHCASAPRRRAPPAHDDDTLDSLRAEVAELKSRLETLHASAAAPPGCTVNQTYITNNHQTNTFNINVSGSEDVSHLTQRLMELCARHGNDGVIRLVQEVLFNPHKPENHNMRIKTMKDFRNGYIEVFGPEGWEVCMKHPVYGRVWKQHFKRLNNVYGRWEWEDRLGAELGPSTDAVRAFMDRGEALVCPGREAPVPREYTRPIDCMVLRCHVRRRRQADARAPAPE